MVLLSNDDFLNQLTQIALKARDNSSFTITLKKYNGHDVPTPRAGKPRLREPDEYQCLLRARFRSKKISTVVGQSDVPRIMEFYAKFMKIHMDGLKKVKKIKSKAKANQG